MIGTNVKVKLDERWLAAQINKQSDIRLSRAAFLVRGVAQRSLQRRKGPAAAGEPPHTHKRKGLRRAILYKVEKLRHTAVIGPAKHLIGTVGGAHEHGGDYKKDRYPERPFMRPALKKVGPHLGRMWRGIVR